MKAQASKWLVAPSPVPKASHSQSDPRAREKPEMRVQRDRARAGLLHVDLEVVLQVGADARAVGDDLDAVLAKLLRRPDAGEHQKLRRVDRRRGDDDLLARAHRLDAAPAAELNADRAAAVEEDPLGARAGSERHVRALQRRAEIGVRGRPAPALPHRHLHRPKALLLRAVVVGGEASSRPATPASVKAR